ncbi:SWI SNF-related [Cryptosporidium bovis]|uniref:SWI SNF-related n=1 Tax=Cryptosporidium bovis TaxID=310047 RepID=UPI00351A7AF3|nr:SWI SNF-related [Cryptosporidium bovis]
MNKLFPVTKIENNNSDIDASIENKGNIANLKKMNLDLDKYSYLDDKDASINGIKSNKKDDDYNLEEENDEYNSGFRRLVKRKRFVRNLSDSSSSSLEIIEKSSNSDLSVNTWKRKADDDSENSDEDLDENGVERYLREKEKRKHEEKISREDDALVYCLDISQRMKKGIVEFFIGNEDMCKEDGVKFEHEYIKNGHCNMNKLTENLRKSEFSEYLSKLEENRLKDYQIVGVSWLLALHKNSYNGILADEMGLGKTAQTCIWLQYLFETKKLFKPVIITCPASLLDNWTKEVSLWAPRLRAVKYHGSQKERRNIADNMIQDYESGNLDVIITTFQMLSSKTDINIAFKYFEFSYMIVDEAHNIKNSASQRYKSLSRKIVSERKLLLTGTPISNSISELSNMLIFLMPRIFSSSLLEDAYNGYKRKKQFDDNKKINSEVLFLQEIISPFVLRRSKQDVLSCLPKKNTFIEFCELTQLQMNQYLREIGFVKKYEKYKKENNVEDEEERNDDNIEDKNNSFNNAIALVDKSLLNAVSKKIQEKVEKHFSSDLSSEKENKEVEEEEEGIDISTEKEELDNDSSPYAVGNNNTNHHYDPKYVNSIIFRMRRICNHSLLHQGYYESKEIGELANYLCKKVPEYMEYSRNRVEQYVTQLCDYEIHQLVKRHIFQLNELNKKKDIPFLEKYLIRDDSILYGGCKLLKMDDIIKKIVFQNKEKCLIFCHHTMLLDIIEEYIRIKYKSENLYLRIDGTTPIFDRQIIIEKYQNTDIPLFLLSTKAAGQGINLTIASSVIMMDLDYNPQIEKQAEDRVHRIGQNKQVKIFKLVCKNTVEENIFNCCQSKLSLDDAFGGKNQKLD